MSITPLTFTGVSQFSSDFQTILNRAVQIASLPVTLLQNRQADIQQEKVLAATLGQSVDALGQSVSALGSLGQSKGLVASSTDTSLVTATATGASASAYYSITNISSIARSAAETSLSGFADTTSAPVSSTGTVQLTIGTTQKTIVLGAGGNNLTGLRDAINALGVGVTASILTTGNGPTPDRLSISADQPGATTLTLVDDPGGAATQMLTSANQGANTVFDLNGAHISVPTTIVNSVIPGVTLNIHGTTTGAQTVGISLASDRGQLASALQNLVTNYNATADQVNAQFGPTAGLLSGSMLVRQTRQAMTALVTYTGTSGSVRTLSDLGIELGRDGKMSLNSDTLQALSDSQVAAGFSFLGSASTGLGALQGRFSAIADPYTGAIKAQQNVFDSEDRRISGEISAITDRVNIMQTALQSKLQAADSLLASLASQQSLLTSTIQSLNFTSYGYNNIAPTKQ